MNQITGQLSIFDFISQAVQQIPVWLQEPKIVKRKRTCPVGTLVKNKDGHVYVVADSKYVEELNNYWLSLKRVNGPKWDFGSMLYESRLSDFGYTIVEKGVNA